MALAERCARALRLAARASGPARRAAAPRARPRRSRGGRAAGVLSAAVEPIDAGPRRVRRERGERLNHEPFTVNGLP